MIRLLERSIRDTEAIDTESLCIVAGQKVWSVNCDVIILFADGNVTDAVCLAVMGSLRAFRKPEITITRENGNRTSLRVHSEDEKESLPLALHHIPLTVSFAIFEGMNIIYYYYLYYSLSAITLISNLHCDHSLCTLVVLFI